MRIDAFLLSLFGAAFATALPHHGNDTSSSNFTVAIVRAPPANMPYPPGVNTEFYGRKYDVNATVELAVGYIREAALKGADLVAFPELWFPGYYFGPSAGPSAALDQYLTQGIAVNSTNWHKLRDAAATHKIWLEFGFARPEGDLIYMGQALIDSAGRVVQIRDKLRPSGGERQIFSDGTTDMLKVHDTPFGRMGVLECWEHIWPTMTFPMHAQVENMHIAAFPWGPDLGVDIGEESADVSLAAARLYAIQGGTWVFMPSVGTAAIIAPNGTVVVQAQASDCPLVQPMLYHSIDTSGFNKTKNYDINGQFSWAALQQINEAYPKYISHEQGTFIPHRENPVPELKKQGPLPDPY